MESEQQSTNDFEDKNILKKHSWYEVSTMREGPSPRVGHCCLFVPCNSRNENSARGGELYIVGGADPNQSFNDVHILEIDSLKWSKLMIGPFHARYEHSVFASDLCPSKLFIFGGADENGNKNDIQYLDIGEFLWKDVTPDGEPPSPRTYHNGVCICDKFFVFGGGGLGSSAVDDNKVHLYDIAKNTWETPIIMGPHPSKRLGHVMVSINNKVYIHGGMNGTEIFDDLHLFDLEMFSWTTIDVKGCRPSPRASHGGIVHGNHIFIMGGLLGPEVSDEIFQFDIETQSWTKRNDLKMPRPALDFAVCSVRACTDKRWESQVHCANSKEVTQIPKLDTLVIIHGGMNIEGDILNDCYIIPISI